ncbi:hypothetical protein K388_04811 [Streptomyces sp. KhCrAH-43]|uniref:hypothetical protein n=1 Tax=unclassified Streptomyces TaxID=2593676 RepID=UPI00048AC165|nr:MULTISPECIES: hypothetical protein [unclassified Streptomyces]MYS36115.1 hypothetical protein [Streptomyces sp. SID4920]MYX70744.1 hypothetical protein [Streptomyces sp. SID8373]RAJ55893.1 hypothetical protein K388_04811 [Streptomyces sp. KhCrAH-43]
MKSEARARLAQLIEERGVDGALRIGTYEGAGQPPGPNLFPPCECRQHSRPDPQDAATGLSIAVREANERSRGERL